MNKLYIVRHGRTEWNDLKIIQGRTDTDLNEVGKEEAKQLATSFDLNSIDICISSPLMRTKSTAEILTQGKVEIIYDDLIIERGYGDYEGKKMSRELIAKQWDYKLNDSSHNTESIRDCLERAEKFINKIRRDYNNKNILIVTHGGFIKALHFVIKGYDENTNFLSFFAPNTKIYEYEI